MLTVSELGLFIGPALLAAVVTAGVNIFQKKRERIETKLVSVLLVATHLEDYAYACATFTFMSHEARPVNEKVAIPALNAWPLDVHWGILPAIPASQAAGIRMEVTIATGMTAATSNEDELSVWQARRLRCELGLRAWQAARALRQKAGLPLIRPEALRWNIIEYLWLEYGKAIRELRTRGMWSAQEEPLNFPDLGYSSAAS
ncbi:MULTISPECIES: hypothetical protein [unclassified Mesorhizobium]|uniref:hypothetical protein n=1 Tax=unclassified Mesorhizobium TaxID=325217 RepID=UPI0003CDEB4E|nr:MULTISPECIES: hypothetical protein [unclassified Mesorhizobium]ESY18271.1 hypothetical protein X751_17295 [Mesorhizobium sp. LNJC395A00]WJI73796.1 hypothetical protein NLY37_22685 [Mesorhizobium sp. C395A]